jgi:hypothetical protein
MGTFTYIGAFLWGFVLLASFAGYGSLIGRLLGRKSSDDGLAIAWGLSLLIIVGGGLNLTRAISPGLIVGLVLAGVAAWLARGGVRRLVMAARGLRGWDYLMLGVLLLGYMNWLCFSQCPEPGKRWSYALVISDDSAYTLYPVQMLHTGGLGIDPFSNRLTQSLGGESFLQALVLAVLPIEYIHLADPGLAYPMMAVLILTMRRVTAPARLALALLFATYPTASQNASAVAIPVVLLVAMARVLGRVRPADPAWSGAGVALPLAALMSLKSTLIPGGVLVVFLWGVILAVMTRRIRPVVFGALVGVFALLMLFPWMVCSYWSAGTLLYPFLGEGFREHSSVAFPHKTGYGLRSTAAVLDPLIQLASKPQTLVVLTGVAAASICILVRRTTAAYRATMIAGCGASLFCIGLFAVVLGIGDAWRYFYPYPVFTNLLAYGTLFRLASHSGRWRHIRAATYLFLSVPILFYGTKAVQRSRDLPDSIAGALAGRARFPAEQIDQYRRIQAAVPPGCRFLCLMDWPLLFDLNRNDFFYADDIGVVSPPPGIPLAGPPEELADYLRSAGCRYVVSPSPRRLEEYIREVGPTLPQLREQHPWLCSIFVNSIKSYRLFCEIAGRYDLLYSDSESMVIDLGSRGGADHK